MMSWARRVWQGRALTRDSTRCYWGVLMPTSAMGLQQLRLAECMSRLGTETAFDVLVRARALEAAGREVVHLEIGEPDFPTATHIIDAASRALHDGWTHYGPSPGLPQLREAVAEDAGRR